MHVTNHQTLERAVFAEWNTTLASHPHVFGRLGELTGDEAIDLIRRPQPAADRDATLLALLTLEHEGDEVAGRVLLKSFLPVAFRLARTSSSTRSLWQHSPTDATATTISVLWEVIHTYPLHRDRAVSGNIRGECLKLLEKDLGTHAGMEITVDTETLDQIVTDNEPWGDDAFRNLVTLLTWAVDSNTLTRDEVALLARIELADGDPGDERERAAAEVGISRETLNRRVHRIRTKLIHAVSGDVAERVPYAPRRS